VIVYCAKGAKNAGRGHDGAAPPWENCAVRGGLHTAAEELLFPRARREARAFPVRRPGVLPPRLLVPAKHCALVGGKIALAASRGGWDRSLLLPQGINRALERSAIGVPHFCVL
jgi:hypothetical protein